MERGEIIWKLYYPFRNSFNIFGSITLFIIGVGFILLAKIVLFVLFGIVLVAFGFLFIMIYRTPMVIYKNGIVPSRTNFERIRGVKGQFYTYSRISKIYPDFWIKSNFIKPEIAETSLIIEIDDSTKIEPPFLKKDAMGRWFVFHDRFKSFLKDKLGDKWEKVYQYNERITKDIDYTEQEWKEIYKRTKPYISRPVRLIWLIIILKGLFIISILWVFPIIIFSEYWLIDEYIGIGLIAANMVIFLYYFTYKWEKDGENLLKFLWALGFEKRTGQKILPPYFKIDRRFKTESISRPTQSEQVKENR